MMTRTIKESMAVALALLIQNEIITLDELENAKSQAWESIFELLSSKIDDHK